MKALLVAVLALAVSGCATPQTQARWHAVAVSKCTLSGHKPGTDKHDACTVVEESKQRRIWENQMLAHMRNSRPVVVPQQRVQPVYLPAPQPAQVNVTVRRPFPMAQSPHFPQVNYGLRVRPY